MDELLWDLTQFILLSGPSSVFFVLWGTHAGTLQAFDGSVSNSLQRLLSSRCYRPFAGVGIISNTWECLHPLLLHLLAVKIVGHGSFLPSWVGLSISDITPERFLNSI